MEEKKKIILFDTLRFFLLAIKGLLEKQYDVNAVQSAEDLFEALTQAKPDIIVIGINVPETKAFDILKELKNDKYYGTIPIIFLANSFNKETVIKGLELNLDDYIVKPFTEQVFFERLDNLFNPVTEETEKPVIMAVDDNPSILQIVNSALKDKYRVRTLTLPKNLIPMLNKITPDLFLLDYIMPELSGFDLVPIIRKHPNHNDTPIIFLTSEGSIGHITAATRLGACDFMVKPVDNEVLREKIAMHLEKFLKLKRLMSVSKIDKFETE